MADAPPTAARVTVDGKFFRRGKDKFHIKGLAYGPFAPNEQGEPFPSPEQAARDFAQIRQLGANLIRVYYVPPRWLLDLATEHGLLVLVDIPWPKHVCFLESYEVQETARRAVRDAVTACRGHTAVFAYSVVNETPAEIVRWNGVRATAGFIDELVSEAKAIDPGCLCTFASFPPTEYLQPQSIDFLLFNVYLHQRKSFESYLARLQMLADAKPLVLGEFGVDSIREGEEHKCEMLAWQIEGACRGGLAGTVVFSYTDDWFRGGRAIDDWAFGLTTRDRQPKPSAEVVRKLYLAAPHFPLPRTPKVSVVVASYNGARTLRACLDSLVALSYPDYEVILVDDGSTDDTPEIAKGFPQVRCLRQPNRGLSVARNAGIAAATGEVVAFTDSDCRADEDWLYYLVNDLVSGDFIGVGGHNFLPPEDSCVAAAVLVSPGGPAHVMLTDREAEHIPGCNMAFYKWALEEIHGFDPTFRKAGDDVDVCWRLQELGYKIGFSAAGFVWHYRRSTVKAYLKQQAGYGEAEALLSLKHPEYFSFVGGGIWRGRIYSNSKAGVLLNRPIIYHGPFASGFFQTLYAPAPALPLMLCTSLEYHLAITLPLLLLTVWFHSLLPLAITSLLLSFGVCAVGAAQAALPRAKTQAWSRPLVALLFFLQPIVRGWARHKWRLDLPSQRARAGGKPFAMRAASIDSHELKLGYWGRDPVDRYAWLKEIFSAAETFGWKVKPDTGWSDSDAELAGGRWARVQLSTASEELGEGRRFFRCRVTARWSLISWIVLCAVAALELMLIGLLAPQQPWIWMLLLTLPVLGLFFDDEKRRQLGWLEVALDELADKLDLEKFHRPRPAAP
jgi:glycosyltransferase involved in cell wall biosynthesis